jgi:hypothetical protein
MRRISITFITALAGVLSIAIGAVGAINAVAASPVAVDPPRSHLKPIVCVTALDPASRAISVTAAMRPVTGTEKMELKFELQGRASATRPFTRVKGGDLNTWVTPKDPTLGQQPDDLWNLIKQVVNLKAPATYRFRVSFRWIGTHDKVLATAVRTSQTCTQPELRPDLQVRTIAVSAVAGRPNANAYTALIRNGGATAAGAFEVQFSDGTVVKNRMVSGLGSHATIKEQFIGPVCTAGAATVAVDPLDEVDDFDRSNNSLNVVCSQSSLERLRHRRASTG